MKLEDIKIGSRFNGYEVYPITSLYTLTNRNYNNNLDVANTLIVPFQKQQNHGVNFDDGRVWLSGSTMVERLHIPVKRTTSTPFIFKELFDELEKNPVVSEFSHSNLNKAMLSMQYLGKTPYLFKDHNSIRVVSLEDITLYIKGDRDIHYAIANLDAMVYHLKEEAKVLTSLEQEINDLNTMGYRE